MESQVILQHVIRDGDQDSNVNYLSNFDKKPLSQLASMQNDTMRAPSMSNATTTTTNMTFIDDDHHSSSTSFRGSSVHAISPTMLSYQNVCLVQHTIPYTDREGHAKIRRALKLRVFADNDDDATTLVVPTPVSYLPGRNYQFLVDPERGTREEGQQRMQPQLQPPNNNTTEHAAVVVVVVNETTVLTMQLFRNPGHCLSDLIFNLAWDRYHRRRQSSSAAPFYPRFVYGTWQQVRTTMPSRNEVDWCFDFMEAANFIQYHNNDNDDNDGHNDNKSNHTNKSNQIRHTAADGSVCFRELLVPLLGLVRFPWGSDDPTVRRVFQRLSVMKPFHMHTYDDDDDDDDDGNNNTSNTTTAEEEYPSQALHELRQSVAHTLGMTLDPWPLTTNATTPTPPHILMYTRQGSRRRHWINAAQVKDALERQYGVSIDVVGTEWESLNTTAQLSLYNQYSHILTVHGAQQANLIMARPGTRIVEIQCVVPSSDPQPDFDLPTMPSSSSYNLAWHGPPSWYSSFTRRLGMHHFLYTETTGCILGNSNVGVHGASQIQVNVSQFVHFVATRWNLTTTTT